MNEIGAPHSDGMNALVADIEEDTCFWINLHRLIKLQPELDFRSLVSVISKSNSPGSSAADR